MQHKSSPYRWLSDIGILLYSITFAVDLVSMYPAPAASWIAGLRPHARAVSASMLFFFLPAIGLLFIVVSVCLRLRARRRGAG